MHVLVCLQTLVLQPLLKIHWFNPRQITCHHQASNDSMYTGSRTMRLTYCKHLFLLLLLLLLLVLQPDESTAAVTYRPSEYPGDLRAAMAMAMRPGGAAAAARDPHVRAVEPGKGPDYSAVLG
jgi:hypothetical protein